MMEQVSRRALFSLGLGALALPAVKLLPDNVLPTSPMPVKLDKVGPKTYHLSKNIPGWQELKVKTLKVKLIRDP